MNNLPTDVCFLLSLLSEENEQGHSDLYISEVTKDDLFRFTDMLEDYYFDCATCVCIQLYIDGSGYIVAKGYTGNSERPTYDRVLATFDKCIGLEYERNKDAA